ncbi:MAG: 5,10-methenyltetrahydrofolate synthetase [Ilumatobacteraceae bacterium]|nr:5,10-methenyltetrahydrofolate synthetase [Ilumatobacteraceae bacterium]
MCAVDDAKQQQRAAMRRIRRAVPARAEQEASMWAQVLDRCAAAGARTVMAFVGVGSEPDTSGLLASLAEAGHVVVLPRVEGDVIVPIVHLPDEPLFDGPFGIPAPTGAAADPAGIDVVVVPALAFTRDGRRLGQGGGFYDRFLPLLRPGCITIGVCFAEQIVDTLVTEPHDRNVDFVVAGVVGE